MTVRFTIDDVPAAGREDVVVVVASGELDYAATPLLRDRLIGHVQAGRRRLVLDLSTVTFIDSTAIGALVGAAAMLGKSGGGSLMVVCVEENERVLRIFDIAGVASAIVLHGSRDDALAALVPVWLADMAVRPAPATPRGAGGESRPPARPSGVDAARRYAQQMVAAIAAQARAAGRGGREHEVDELA